MVHRIDLIPDMEYQRYGPWGVIPDLTCGRYCLKSLLKYWHEKAGMGHVTRLTLEAPASTLSHWAGYDAWNDYQHAAELLVHDTSKPNTARGWELRLIYAKGPIIIGGRGVGAAFQGFWGYGAIPHAILLTGINPANVNATFEYLDPLRGNGVQTAPWTMQARIYADLVYAQHDITNKLGLNPGKYYTRAFWDMFPWARF